jgi:hypothetical protein
MEAGVLARVAKGVGPRKPTTIYGGDRRLQEHGGLIAQVEIFSSRFAAGFSVPRLRSSLRSKTKTQSAKGKNAGPQRDNTTRNPP